VAGIRIRIRNTCRDLWQLDSLTLDSVFVCNYYALIAGGTTWLRCLPVQPEKNEEKTAALHPLDSQVAQSHSTQNAETQTAIVSRIFSVFFPVRYTKRKLF